MNRLAEQLDKKLRTLDSSRAKYLELLVREALARAEQEVEPEKMCNSSSGWPADYFEQTAGTLSGEDFQRPLPGELPQRDDW